MVIVLPLFLLVISAGIQLIWLLLAKHILLTATSYVALYAAVAPADVTGQQLIFQQRIKAVQRGDLVVPKIHLITPDADLSRRVADYEVKTQDYSFDPSFATLQLREILAKSKLEGVLNAEEWLLMSNIQVEIEWCFRIRIPAMGLLLQQAFHKGVLQGGTGCELYSVLKDGYYIPLRAVARAPLHTKWQWRLE